MDLLDKVALVTGGSMGIGAAIAGELARRGAAVALVARHGGPPAREVQQQIDQVSPARWLATVDLHVNAKDYITGETFVIDGGLTSRVA